MKYLLYAVLTVGLIACSSGSDDSNQARSSIAIPELALWEAQMIQFGESLVATLQSPRTDSEVKLAETYYDAQWVFYQIGDYTGDSRWYDFAQVAEATYRDYYVIPNDAFVPGFWNFPHGLAQDYLRTGDPVSKAAVVGLASNAAFARDTTDPSETFQAEFSRETAYAIHSYIQAESVGEPRRERLDLLIEHALGHLDQWFVSKDAPYVRPFMVGLTAHALISYYESVHSDPRILTALQNAADQMWQTLWLSEQASFKYTDRETSSGGTEPAPDLNLLIAPLYAWLYSETSDEKYLEQGDQIFRGGVLNAYLEAGKQYNQNYRWSFDYIRYRST